MSTGTAIIFVGALLIIMVGVVLTAYHFAKAVVELQHDSTKERDRLVNGIMALANESALVTKNSLEDDGPPPEPIYMDDNEWARREGLLDETQTDAGSGR